MVNTESNLVKAKLLIVISSDHYIRNYITTDAFKELRKDYNVLICCRKKLKIRHTSLVTIMCDIMILINVYTVNISKCLIY